MKRIITLTLITVGLAACGTQFKAADAPAIATVAPTTQAPTTEAKPVIRSCPAGQHPIGDACTLDNPLPAPTAPPTTAAAVTNIEFVQAFYAIQGSNMDRVSSEMSAAGDSANSMDIDGVQRHAQRAADMFSDMYDTAVSLPGADTVTGTALIKAFATCRDAYQRTATGLEGLSILDPNIVDVVTDATAFLGDCSNDLTTATATIG